MLTQHSPMVCWAKLTYLSLGFIVIQHLNTHFGDILANNNHWQPLKIGLGLNTFSNIYARPPFFWTRHWPPTGHCSSSSWSHTFLPSYLIVRHTQAFTDSRRMATGGVPLRCHGITLTCISNRYPSTKYILFRCTSILYHLYTFIRYTVQLVIPWIMRWNYPL